MLGQCRWSKEFRTFHASVSKVISRDTKALRTRNAFVESTCVERGGRLANSPAPEENYNANRSGNRPFRSPKHILQIPLGRELFAKMPAFSEVPTIDSIWF